VPPEQGRKRSGFENVEGAFDILNLVFRPSIALGHAVRWSCVLILNMVYRLHLGMEALWGFDNDTRHNDTNVDDGIVCPAEALSGIIGVVFEG